MERQKVRGLGKLPGRRIRKSYFVIRRTVSRSSSRSLLIPLRALLLSSLTVDFKACWTFALNGRSASTSEARLRKWPFSTLILQLFIPFNVNQDS